MPTAIYVPEDFNPRSREGSDVQAAEGNARQMGISIHAPAKGATSRRTRIRSNRKFQSTLPRRERPGIQKTLKRIREISIHAPAKGAT